MTTEFEGLSSNEAAANAAPLSWEEAFRQMKRRHADFAKALQEKAMERSSTIKPEELTPADALKWLEPAQRSNFHRGLTRMTEGDLWERLPGESAKAYDAFRCYRDMGPKRSIAKVARAMGCSTGLLKRWSSTYRWVARATRYDDHLDERRREAHERIVLETAAKHAALAQTAQEQALLRLSSIDVNSLTFTQLLQFTKASIELEAAAYGVR